MSEFKVIETQEQLDEVIKKRLEREKAKYADYDSLSEKIQNLEAEKLNLQGIIEENKESEEVSKTRIAELEKTIGSWESKALKQQVAIKYNLPFELATRLQGDTEDSLNEDAERLASLVNVSKSVVTPLADVESKQVGGVDGAWRDLVKGLK